MNTEVEIAEPGNQHRQREMRLCNHCANPLFFTAKLPAMNGDKCKCPNGLAPNSDGLRAKDRSENECAQILRFAIFRFLPPVTFACNAGPSWRRFTHDYGSSVGPPKNAPAAECNPVCLAHRIGAFYWQTPGMKLERQTVPATLTLKPLRPNGWRTAHLQTPKQAKPSQHSRSTLAVTVLSPIKWTPFE